MRFTFLTIGSVALLAISAIAAEKPKHAPKPEDMEEATRLQIFLDKENFSPGKIDGRYGDFTLKALALYREAHGEAQSAPPPQEKPVKKKKDQAEAKPDLSGLDLSSVDPVIIDYAVTDQDVGNTGDLPKTIPEESKLKWLPYKTVAEAVAEKFHCDADYFEKLNPGKTATLKAGDHVRVPNVPPFDLNAIKETAEHQKKEEEKEKKKKKSESSKEQHASSISIKVDTKTNILQVLDKDRLIAAYPVTVGSSHTESPIGEWQIKEIAGLPVFRYDKEMLNHGERSGNYYNLAPGPNNLVGVMWIALNKKGIGLHGTNEPDTIGRSASHGCVRLANWDVVRLAEKVTPGVPVSIH